MDEYIKIGKQISRNVPIYAFDKLDGSLIRAEWSKEYGFWKYGSREVLLDRGDARLGDALKVLVRKYNDSIPNILMKNKIQSATCFFEFFGPQSFAGNHIPKDEFDIVLLDVSIDGSLFVPRKFLKLFGDLDIPKLLYRGKANQVFEQQVREGKLSGMTFEGVVCKGINPKTNKMVMFKIKNDAWLNKLKNFCGDDAEKFRRLS